MKITLLILITIGCLIVAIAGMFRKRYPNYQEEIEDMYKRENEKFIYPEIPFLCPYKKESCMHVDTLSSTLEIDCNKCNNHPSNKYSS